MKKQKISKKCLVGSDKSALGVLQNPHYALSRSADKLAHNPPDGKLHNHGIAKSTYGHIKSAA